MDAFPSRAALRLGEAGAAADEDNFEEITWFSEEIVFEGREGDAEVLR